MWKGRACAAQQRVQQGMMKRGGTNPSTKLPARLQVFKGTEHPHIAQQPKDITNKISKKPADAL